MQKPSTIIRPAITLAFLAGVGILCFLLMAIFPVEGIQVGAYKLRFKSLWAQADTSNSKKLGDVGAYLDQLDSLASDSTLLDSINGLVVERKQGLTSLQFKDGDSSPLFTFFEALHRAKDIGEDIHVLHYGDSQIETDRMTNYIREKWQQDFGGRGPGLLSPIPVAPGSAMKQSWSSNWKRYTAYGFDTGKASHSRYGIMASFGRFSDEKEAGAIDLSDTIDAWIEFGISGMAQPNCRNFSEATLYFGYHKSPLEIQAWVNDSLIESRHFEAQASLVTEKWHFGYTPKKLKFVFRGSDSPDVHSLVLQSAGGVHVDNIALRGSNGNIFKRIDGTDIQKEISDLHAELIILQFGGNSIPYIASEKGAKDYANFFQAQIQYLKRMAPQAAFIVVGPSDMSTSIDGVMQSFPYIESVRTAMKEAAFTEGCAFWDMYEVMGGKNSMVSWVSNDPPYAGPDYTHFTPVGARKIAELFYKSIKTEYDAWLKAKDGI